MNLPHDQFCILPWISLEASPIGSVRPCCLAEKEIPDDNGVKFNLASADLNSVKDSQYMRNLRQEFLDGCQPSTCRKCWSEELAGRTSKRMHTLDRLKHVITDEVWTTESKPLQFLDLKLGNICNLKCRICGSWSSSQFATEEIYHTPVQEKKSSFHYQMLKLGAWPRENQSFWTQINDLLDGLKYIEFTGGEPFMIQEHFDMLREIQQRGLAGNIEIHYNTNGTHFPEFAEEIWKDFKTVEIAFSIDDLSKRFEYQRTNAKWYDVYCNLTEFRMLKSRLPNLQLQVCATVNVFNVFYLEDLADWIDRQGFDFVYWNMLHEAFYFSVGSLPHNVKAQVISKLQLANVRNCHKHEFDRIIDFINQGASLDGVLLREKIAELDQRRGTNLRHHHREFAEAIGYEFA